MANEDGIARTNLETDGGVLGVSGVVLGDSSYIASTKFGNEVVLAAFGTGEVDVSCTGCSGEVHGETYSATEEESVGDATISGCVHDISSSVAGVESVDSDILSGCMHDETRFAAKEELIADTVFGLVQDHRNLVSACVSRVSSAPEALEGGTTPVPKCRREFINSFSARPLVPEDFHYGDDVLEPESVLACTEWPLADKYLQVSASEGLDACDEFLLPGADSVQSVRHVSTISHTYGVHPMAFCQLCLVTFCGVGFCVDCKTLLHSRRVLPTCLSSKVVDQQEDISGHCREAKELFDALVCKVEPELELHEFVEVEHGVFDG